MRDTVAQDFVLLSSGQGESMIQPSEIGSLTDFTRNSAEAIKRLKETGQPQVLTVDGRAEVVVLDVASYQRLLELADRAEAIEGVRRGLESMARGEGRSVQDAFAELRARCGIRDEP
jgi:prevent-host-death family protein